MKYIRGNDFTRARSRRVADTKSGHLSRFLAVAMAWVLVSVSCVQAQQANPTEYAVKAAYLYNFGKFVEWPVQVTAAADVFTICVLGEDPFGATFDTTIAGESLNGKKVAVNRIARLQDAVSCRILFISSSEQGRLKEILAALDKTSVLTVSDMPQFTRRGGMIQFIMAANKVRFEVNLTNAERTGLTLSSQLLKVAISVRTNSQSGG
jgi:hypothetical protein